MTRLSTHIICDIYHVTGAYLKSEVFILFRHTQRKYHDGTIIQVHIPYFESITWLLWWSLYSSMPGARASSAAVWHSWIGLNRGRTRSKIYEAEITTNAWNDGVYFCCYCSDTVRIHGFKARIRFMKNSCLSSWGESSNFTGCTCHWAQLMTNSVKDFWDTLPLRLPWFTDTDRDGYSGKKQKLLNLLFSFIYPGSIRCLCRWKFVLIFTIYCFQSTFNVSNRFWCFQSTVIPIDVSNLHVSDRHCFKSLFPIYI